MQTNQKNPSIRCCIMIVLLFILSLTSLYFMCLSLRLLILFILFYLRNSIMNLYKKTTWVSWLVFAIQRLVKYISIQETHYIVPIIRSSPIENKLQCVVLLRFANCISSALQKPIEIKCKLHDETHDTLSLIRL